MFKRLILPALIAGTAALALPAAAAPLPAAPQSTYVGTTANPALTEVRHTARHARQERRVDRRAERRYDRRIHGDRCIRRLGECRHYHRGYYYRTPWWLVTAPFVGAQIIIRGDSYGSRHMRWCENSYRSYDRRTNTWVGYSGRVYQCNSPYDNR